MGFFNAPKFPTISELFKAKGTAPNASVPAPTTWFGLNLRIVLMVLLAVFGILGAAQTFLLIPAIWNPFYLILFILGFVSILITLFGLLAVYRLVPEWMVAYGYFVVGFLFIDAIWMIGYAISGFIASSLIFFAFRVLFTIMLIQCLMALRSYALSCMGLGV
ncbi:hypothetical protein BC829DRAFT_388031 [Chytridium lagenaria]|nr:hypothetical protein BC829DRAFT_388031 [Chytridium lagenaria]